MDVDRALASTKHELTEMSRLAVERAQALDALKTQVDSVVARMDSLHSRSGEAAAHLDELVSVTRPPESEANATYEELQQQLRTFSHKELEPLASEAVALAQAARAMSEPPPAVEEATCGPRCSVVLGADSAHALENELAEVKQSIDELKQQHAARFEHKIQYNSFLKIRLLSVATS